MNQDALHFSVTLLIITVSLLVTSPVSARYKAFPTPVEWDSLPEFCQKWSDPPEGRQTKKMTEEARNLWLMYGIHHACEGYVALMRLELGITLAPQQREGLLRAALGEIHYSVKSINEREELKSTQPAAWVFTSYARALRQAKKPKKALAILNQTRELHPTYVPLYSVYTALYFDQKDYAPLITLLEEGNEATHKKFGEIQYYLGLTYFKAGDIENARLYEQKARENGYPLRYLTRKLAEHDAKQSATAN